MDKTMTQGTCWQEALRSRKAKADDKTAFVKGKSIEDLIKTWHVSLHDKGMDVKKSKYREVFGLSSAYFALLHTAHIPVRRFHNSRENRTILLTGRLFEAAYRSAPDLRVTCWESIHSGQGYPLCQRNHSLTP